MLHHPLFIILAKRVIDLTAQNILPHFLFPLEKKLKQDFRAPLSSPPPPIREPTITKHGALYKIQGR